MGPLAVVIIGGTFGLSGVFLGWMLSRYDRSGRDDRRDAITLAQVAAGMARIEDGQGKLWEAVDGLAQRVARIEGHLGHPSVFPGG